MVGYPSTGTGCGYGSCIFTSSESAETALLARGSAGAIVSVSIILRRCGAAVLRVGNVTFHTVFASICSETSWTVPRSQVQMLHSAEVYANAF
jgi:hypothetical protein